MNTEKLNDKKIFDEPDLLERIVDVFFSEMRTEENADLVEHLRTEVKKF